MTGVLTRRGAETCAERMPCDDTDPQRGDGHVTTEAGIGVMQLQVKKHHRLLETSEAKRKAWNRFDPRVFRKNVGPLTPPCRLLASETLRK